MSSNMQNETIQVRRAGTSVSLEIRVPKEAIHKKEEEILRRLDRELRIPGFRPGKAPKSLLLRRYGEEAFWRKVQEHLIQDWLDKALKELTLRPLTAPKVKTLEFVQGEALSFQVEFEVLPEFTIPEDLVLSVAEPPPAEVKEEEIAAVLTDLQREAATLAPKGTPAEEGDLVVIRRGEQIWEGQATSEHPVGRQLLGTTAGTKLILSDEEGQAEEFEVVSVHSLILPSLEETARYYNKSSWEELKEEVRQELLVEAEARRQDELRRRALDALAAALNISVPPRLLAETVEEEMEYFAKHPEMRPRVESAVAARLRREILIHRLAEEKGLYPDPKEVRKMAEEEGEEEEEIHNRLLFERTTDWILTHLRREK